MRNLIFVVTVIGEPAGPVPALPAVLRADPALLPGPQARLLRPAHGQRGAGAVGLAGLRVDLRLRARRWRRSWAFPKTSLRATSLWVWATHEFPGLGKEFMPPGRGLVPVHAHHHAPRLDRRGAGRAAASRTWPSRRSPRSRLAVGKIGRVDSPLDPAPISMIETIINYNPEYLSDESGHRLQYAFDPARTTCSATRRASPCRRPTGALHGRRQVPARRARQADPRPGRPAVPPVAPALDPRLNPGARPGRASPSRTTSGTRSSRPRRSRARPSAPRLQPIAARIVMLQSGMRAPMGVRILGDDLEKIEQVGFADREAAQGGAQASSPRP